MPAYGGRLQIFGYRPTATGLEACEDDLRIGDQGPDGVPVYGATDAGVARDATRGRSLVA